MRRTARRALIGTSALTLATAMTVVPLAQAGAATDPGKLTAKALAPDSTFTARKSDTGKLAQSDPKVLARTDSAMVNVVVKLDYDGAASYTGNIAGLPATSPKVTGKKLSGQSAAEKAYAGYTGKQDKDFRAQLAAKVPSAKAGTSLQTVYGGLSVRLPASQAKALLTIPGVAAVQSDTVNKPEALPEAAQFIGAPTIWRQTGGQSVAGKGVIFADLDSGIWPEHPMLTDNPALGTPPGAPSGVARACVFGDNPLTPATDVFRCNHKVIGGQPFLATYNANVGGEVYPDTARDSDGHGTHTTTTAAGGAVSTAKIFGVERGPISGVAPGAWVLEYKVCGATGCFGSDTAAAVQQAIKDGADVINYSISGGAQPFSDPTELAFLDAYNAGIFVAASAGNSGPGAATTDHRSPWVTTVAASTQERAFTSTLTVTATDGASQTFPATTLTQGVTTPAPIVLAQNIPGYTATCLTPLPAGAAAGKIVACQRGNPAGRVTDGFNVKQGGAVGMILYNPVLADTESDNHFLPVVHLADGRPFVAFMTAHPTANGSWPQGEKTAGQGDVMAAFSSRGPGGQFIKPDITAPGVQVLAGNTPTPDALPAGPAGEYYQAIAGTSMSSPNIAGSAILVKALRSWLSPGQIKSSLMTTATTDVVKEDLTTPADPFDMGAGRVDLTKAGAAPITFADTADNMVAIGRDPLAAVNLNIPSVNLPTMPGAVTVTRTAVNVSGRAYQYDVRTTAPAGSKIKVSPDHGRIRAGQSQTFQITVTSSADPGQYFGQIRFVSSGNAAVHLPVAFVNKQGDISMAQTCDPASVAVRASTTCTVTAQNNAAGDAAVTIDSSVTNGLRITGAAGASVSANGRSASAGPLLLAAPKDAVPSIAAGAGPAGFIPLSAFGIAPNAIGDEAIQNYNLPPFVFGGRTFTRIGVTSNGYAVLGGGTGGDVRFGPNGFGNPVAPNGILAPYWTDLDGTDAPGITVGNLTDGVNSWIVLEWDVHLFGVSTATRSFQTWIGINGAEDISYSYDAATIGKAGDAAAGLGIGVENVTGTKGAEIAGTPQGDYRVTTIPGEPGGKATVTLTIQGRNQGSQTLTSSLRSNVTLGETVVRTPITVTR